MNQVTKSWKKGTRVICASTNAGPLDTTLVFHENKPPCEDIFMVTMTRIEALELAQNLIAHALENMKEEM